MGVLLFLIFDRAQGLPHRPDAVTPVAGVEPAVVGHTQELGAFLFQHHFVNLQMAGLILTVAMIGAIMISRRQIVAPAAGEQGPGGGEVLLGPATPVDDDPHSIPVYGTSNPRQKAYPEA
jgi:NADH-quinone oxidoreductase subunit J